MAPQREITILNGWELTREKARLGGEGELLKRKRFLRKLKVAYKNLQHYNLVSTRTKFKHNFQSIPSGSCAQLWCFKTKRVAIPLHTWKTTIARGIYSNGFILVGGKSCIFIPCTCWERSDLLLLYQNHPQTPAPVVTKKTKNICFLQLLSGS